MKNSEALAAEVSNLLDDDRFEFAWDTLDGIEYALKHGARPTLRMWSAVKNIKQQGEKHEQS